MGFWVCELCWYLIFNWICLVIKLCVCVCVYVAGPLVSAAKVIGLWWCLSLSLSHINNQTQKPHTNVEHKTTDWSLMENNITTHQQIRIWEVRHNLPMNAENHSGGNNALSREKVSSSDWRTEAGFVFSVYSSILMVVWSMVGRWNSF